MESLVQLFTQSSSADFLSARYIPGSILDIRTRPKQHRVTPAFTELTFQWGENRKE